MLAAQLVGEAVLKCTVILCSDAIDKKQSVNKFRDGAIAGKYVTPAARRVCAGGAPSRPGSPPHGARRTGGHPADSFPGRLGRAQWPPSSPDVMRSTCSACGGCTAIFSCIHWQDQVISDQIKLALETKQIAENYRQQALNFEAP